MNPVAPKPAARKPAAKVKAPVAVIAEPAATVSPVIAPPEPVETVMVEPAIVEPAIVEPAIVEPAIVDIEPATETVAAKAEEAIESIVEEAMTAVEEIVPAPVVPAITPPVIPPIAKVIPMTAMPTAPFKGYDEFAAFSKANMDAFILANQVFAKGIEEMSKEMMNLTQSSMESAAAAAKAVFTAKTFKDVVELNTDYTKSSFDKFVANSTKLSEMGVKVATDAMAPVTARVNVAVEKMLKPVAQ